MAKFLSIVTRHMMSRKKMFEAHLASLAAQTDQDFEHIVIPDEVGRGMAWAQQQLVRAADFCSGRYILILDDDDLMANIHGVEYLKACTEGDPPAVIFRGDHGELGILPPYDWWGMAPHLGTIGSFDYIIRRDIFQDHVAVCDGQYSNDHHLIASVYAEHGPAVMWLEAIICAVQQRSLGARGW